MSEFDVISRTDVAKVILNSAPDRPGIGAQIFGALWSYDINVELVSSAPAPEGKADITLVVGKDHLNPAILKLKKMKEDLDARDLTVDQDIAKEHDGRGGNTLRGPGQHQRRNHSNPEAYGGDIAHQPGQDTPKYGKRHPQDQE